MAFLNEEDLAENVKKFPVLHDKSNDELIQQSLNSGSAQFQILVRISNNGSGSK